MPHAAAIPNPALQSLARLVGTWTTTGRHPAVAETVHGRATFAWVDGGAFLRMETHVEDARFPDGLAYIGSDGETLSMLYFDQRGVSRRYGVRVEGNVWSWSRDAQSADDLSQRFTVTISDDGSAMDGVGEMSRSGGAWEGDLAIAYRR